MKRPILTALVVGLVMFSTTPGSAFADCGAEAKNYADAVEYRVSSLRDTEQNLHCSEQPGGRRGPGSGGLSEEHLLLGPTTPCG